jgi:CubicO group peptidase (beta-lactamase class C family)
MKSRFVSAYSLPALLVLALSPALGAAANPRPDRAVIERILDQSRKAWQAPGIVVAIVKDDRVDFFAKGQRELGSDGEVTKDTLFPIGSCTKAFTAAALAILVDEGKADWNDLVRKHLPWFRLDDPLADRQVAVCDLLCHRIGLARHDLLWYRAPWGIEESVRRMAFLERGSSFRSKYEYNNLAYLAAGLVIASAAQKPWNEFVRERLFGPLHMDSAVFTSGEAKKAPDHAGPHGHNASGKVVAVPWYDDDKQIRASGSIKASANDLSQWVRFQLAGGKYNGTQLVSADALETTHTGHIPVPLDDASRAAGATQTSYGLGWVITDYRGHSLHEHSGAVDGFRARVLLVDRLDPEKRFGVVVLTNLEDMGIVQATGNALLDHLLGLEEKDWNAFFAAEHEKAAVARKPKPRRPIRDAKLPGELDAYTGTFSEPAYGTVAINRKDGSLTLSWSSFRLPLENLHYSTFVTPPKGDRLTDSIRDETIIFEMNEDGEVSTLRFLGRKFTRQAGRNRGKK